MLPGEEEQKTLSVGKRKRGYLLGQDIREASECWSGERFQPREQGANQSRTSLRDPRHEGQSRCVETQIAREKNFLEMEAGKEDKVTPSTHTHHTHQCSSASLQPSHDLPHGPVMWAVSSTVQNWRHREVRIHSISRKTSQEDEMTDH